jgi:putative DNA primase/helicase
VDRCIVIRMQRKVAGEKCERPRKLETAELNRKCARFVLDNAEAIAGAQPELPSSLHDRAGDIWEPLIVLADLAGGDWPERARQAAVGLTTSAQENCPIGTLLFDLFVVFTARGAEKLFTREVLEGLSCLENRPWHSMRRGTEVTEAWLAQRLRPYGIKPQTIRVGEDVGRGYRVEDFTESLRRYVPKTEREELLAELKGQVARREEKSSEH